MNELIDVPAGEYGKPRLLTWCEQDFRRCNLMGTVLVKNYLENFVATVSAQHDFQGRDLRPSIDDLRSWLIHAQESGQSTPDYLQPLIKKFPEIENDDIEERRIVDRWIAIYEKDNDFQYRQFGITKKGLLMVGPQAMEPGHLVCLLHGGELAYILRPAKEKYYYLEECYIHGLNLRFKSHSGNDFDWDWFCLVQSFYFNI
jgi:hypothetical protein